MYYLPIYLLIASIITVYLCMRASMHPRVTSKVRFLKHADRYEDLSTGQYCQRYRDDHGYFWYGTGERFNPNTWCILSEREYSENVREEIAKRDGDKYFKSTTRVCKGLVPYGFCGTDCFAIRETQTGVLYVVGKCVKHDYKNNMYIEYHMYPVEEDKPRCHPHSKMFYDYTKDTKLSKEEYDKFLNIPVKDNGKEYGNNDISFMKTNKFFKHAWLWK